MLNLPILETLENSQNILIVGIGGGYDVFAGLPLYFTLKNHGKQVFLAGYNKIDNSPEKYEFVNPVLRNCKEISS